MWHLVLDSLLMEKKKTLVPIEQKKLKNLKEQLNFYLKNPIKAFSNLREKVRKQTKVKSCPPAPKKKSTRLQDKGSSSQEEEANDHHDVK